MNHHQPEKSPFYARPSQAAITPTIMNAPASLLVIALAATTLLTGCVVPPPRSVHYTQQPETQAAPAVEPLYFYPERGQDDTQQDRDRYECYRWAVRETGVDPGMQPVQRDAAPSTGPVMRDGAAVATGAVTGAIIGATVSSPRHAGPAMVLGAIFGSVLGAAVEENHAQAIEQQQESRRRQWDARQQVPMDAFRRAMSACMSGRGYSVR